MEGRKKKKSRLICLSSVITMCIIFGIFYILGADKGKSVDASGQHLDIMDNTDVTDDTDVPDNSDITSSDNTASSSEDNVVRVGYFISDNFQEGEENERKYGYGYEYLQMISYYTGWKYEYVYGKFYDLLTELENGEIDIMGGITYTDSRGEKIDFSSEIQGEEYYYLYACNGTELDVTDVSILDGIKVGINEGSYQVNLFRKWCSDRNISCDIVEYSYEDQRLEDLANGIIDAVVAGENYNRDNIVPLCQIGEVPFYFGVSTTQPELLEQLDDAMSKILETNIYYNNQLRAKYIPSSSVAVTTLTEDEENWIQEKSTIKVGYLNDYMPYCGTDEDTGKVTGMLADLISNIKNEYSIDFSLTSYDSYTELMADLKKGKLDAVFPFYGDYSIAEYMNVMTTDSVTNTTMTVFNGESVRKEVQKIAVTDTDPFQKYYASIYYPEAEQIIYETLPDCADAILNGETEFTVVETAIVNEADSTFYKKKLQNLILNESVNISFAVRMDDKNILTILNKGIMATDDSLITNSLIYHSQENLRYTVKDFLSEHVVMVVICLIVVSLAVIGNIVAYFINRMRSQKRIWEAESKEKNVRWKAEHDSLTGLLNRASFNEICNDLSESVSPLAILVIDVDKFKNVNDTYGHETGDKALVKVAKVLTQYFRSGDYVVRYAGDEFVVLMMGITTSETNVVASKIGKINETLQNPDDDIPKLSVSIGVAFSKKGYTEDLFNKADQALYHTKENGRCGYSIYEE